MPPASCNASLVGEAEKVEQMPVGEDRHVVTADEETDGELVENGQTVACDIGRTRVGFQVDRGRRVGMRLGWCGLDARRVVRCRDDGRCTRQRPGREHRGKHGPMVRLGCGLGGSLGRDRRRDRCALRRGGLVGADVIAQFDSQRIEGDLIFCRQRLAAKGNDIVGRGPQQVWPERNARPRATRSDRGGPRRIR